MKAGNTTPGVRNHRADFPCPAALGQSPHASHTCRASSICAWRRLPLARRLKLVGGAPARPGRRVTSAVVGHVCTWRSNTPEEEGLGRGRGQPQPEALQHVQGGGYGRPTARNGGHPGRAVSPLQNARRFSEPGGLHAERRHLGKPRFDDPFAPRRRRLCASAQALTRFRLGARFVSAFAWFRGLLGSAPTPTLFR